MKIAVTRGFENEIDIKSDFSTIWRPGTVWRRNVVGLLERNIQQNSSTQNHSESEPSFQNMFSKHENAKTTRCF